MTGLPFEPIGIVLIMMAVLIVLGCSWTGSAILLLTMPIFVPIIEDLGYDLIWFGILFCMNMQIGYLSPPFGPAAFYLKSVAPPEITLHDIFKRAVAVHADADRRDAAGDVLSPDRALAAGGAAWRLTMRAPAERRRSTRFVGYFGRGPVGIMMWA